MHAGFPESSAVKGVPEAYRWYPGEWQLGTMCRPHDEDDSSTMKDVTIVEPTVTIMSTMKESDYPAMEALVNAIK